MYCRYSHIYTIHYFHFSHYELSFQANGVGKTSQRPKPTYTFPACVLAYLRALLPDQIKGEFREVS